MGGRSKEIEERRSEICMRRCRRRGAGEGVYSKNKWPDEPPG